MEQLSFDRNLTVPGALAGGMNAGRRIGSLALRPAHPKASEPSAAGPRFSSPAQADAETGNVTEIILPAGQGDSVQLLLPMLTQLNQERRWLALIDPPAALVGKWQTMHGIVATELLVLRSTPEHSAQELAERALSAGTCHAVVMWTSKLARPAFRALQAASAIGNSHGVVLRQR